MITGSGGDFSLDFLRYLWQLQNQKQQAHTVLPLNIHQNTIIHSLILLSQKTVLPLPEVGSVPAAAQTPSTLELVPVE